MHAEPLLGFFLQNIGFPELALILGLGVLFFGRNLPSVGRSLGKSIVEFKKGLKGIEEEIDDATTRPEAKRPASSDRLEGDAPKFT
jgi:sec-independent protein translocase protein TatA